MSYKNNPIGLFDSGVGGLSVLREIYNQLPCENTLYFADHMHIPYSIKPEKLIKKYVFEIINFLLGEKAKIIVIACNVATSIALEDAREKFNIPIVGVIEPGAKMAVKATKNKAVGILGPKKVTEIYKQIIGSLDSTINLFGQPCSDFANFVEQGLVNPKKIQETANICLKPLKEKRIDTLIFGCTHYPFLKDFIRKVMESKVKFVDPSRETVLGVKEILKKSGSLNVGRQEESIHKFFVSGHKQDFKFVAEKLIGKRIDSVEQDILL